MKKEKIAISIDKGILEAVDSNIDGILIRSRSQAIEAILSRGLKMTFIDTAVILLHPKHIKLALKKIDGATLILRQTEFFKSNLIKSIKIATGFGDEVEQLMEELKGDASVEVVQSRAEGNANALFTLKDSLPENFVVMSGDVFNDFSIQGMIKEHIEKGRFVTMGLMTKEKTSDYGTAILDGNMIVEFSEKSKHADAHVVNAGVYVFR